jgi:hypothetical protein
MRRRRSSAVVIAAVVVLVASAAAGCSGDDTLPAADGTSPGAASGLDTTEPESNGDTIVDGTATTDAGGDTGAGATEATESSDAGVDGTAAAGESDGSAEGPADTARDDGSGGALSLDRWQRQVLDDARPDRAIFIAAGDLDEDGDADVVTGAWWYENPGSNAGPWQRNELGSPLNNEAVVHDLDEDGHLDVLGTEGVGSTANADFAFARGDGTGTLAVTSPVATAEGDFLQGACVARFDPDGPLQIALSWHQAGRGIQLLTVPENPAEDSWPWEQIETSSQDEALSCGDIDGDGDVDLLLGTRWLRNDGASWSLELVSDVDGDPDRNRLVDMNGDGRLDAVVGFQAISVEGKLAWYQQPESPGEPWTEQVIASDVVGPMSVGVADLDDDGDPDVVVGEHNLASPDDARLLVYENTDGAGTSWQVHTVHRGDEHHDGAELVDIDADGDLDIVSIGWGHGRVVLYENLSR